MPDKQLSPIEGARILTSFCGQVRKGDRVLIVTDDTTHEVGLWLHSAAKELTDNVNWLKTSVAAMHGSEPIEEVARAMLESDVIFGATQSSMAHTQARLSASNKGARYLSLPDYSIEQLTSPALSVDFIEWAKAAKKLKDVLDEAKNISITSKSGTNLSLDCTGRSANFCPGFCAKAGSLGSPPDIETNVPPLEDKSNGVLIVDGSIPCKEIGVVKEAIAVKIKDGLITEIDETVQQGKVLKNIFDSRSNDKTRVLAEFGIGLNPNARLCGRMLEDEGCLGTIHFGFGSNSTIGGLNKVDFHLDFVIRSPTVYVDGSLLIKDGQLCFNNE